MPEAPEVLETARVIGRRLGPEDLPDFKSYYADPLVMATLSADGKPWPASDSVDLFRRHRLHWEEHGFGTWFFRDVESGRFLARAGLRSVDVGAGPVVELFYGVASDRWGEGLATEIAMGIIEVAFHRLAMNELCGFTLPANGASRRVLEKCGFERAGEITHAGLRHLFYRLDSPA